MITDSLQTRLATTSQNYQDTVYNNSTGDRTADSTSNPVSSNDPTLAAVYEKDSTARAEAQLQLADLLYTPSSVASLASSSIQQNAVTYPKGRLFGAAGQHLRIDINVDDKRATLKVLDTSSTKAGKALFYIRDGLGRKKAVSLSLDDSNIEYEFLKRFKKFPEYKKTVSLDNYEKLIKKVKESMTGFTEISWKRLQSKELGESESQKFDKVVQTFIDQIKQMHPTR